jgi:hypothetical protein
VKRPGAFLVSIGALVLFLSCAAGNPYREADSHAQQGDYQRSLEIIEKDKKSFYRDKDAILYYLDAGMLNHYTADYRRSTELLQEGERAIEAAYTRSITMEIATYITNDTAQEYAGEDYEDVYLNAFNALNYYHENKLEDAMVEIRRMNNKLAFLASKYGIIVDRMQQEALSSEGREIPPDPSAGQSTFTNSALARYLGMLFYRGNGNPDDARIDRDQIRIAFANSPSVYSYPPPKSLDEELSVPAGKARFNVVAFSGSAPVKEEEILRILVYSFYTKIALPVMTPRYSVVNRIVVRFDSGESLELELLEDIEAVVRETFKERAHLIYLKSVLRAMIKGVASSVMDGAGDEIGGDAGTILGLLSFGTKIFTEVSEKADLRISRYFPAKAYVGGITLEPGLHSYSIIYYSGSHVVDSFRRENVMIRAGGVNLAEAVCLK